MNDDLSKKVDLAIRLLQSIPTIEGPVELSYSGGKDSDVILELAKMAGINYRAIYKNTTIDPPGTIAHARDAGAEIIQPKETFFHLIRKYGYPSRWARFCCRELKEYKVLDRAIHGIRRCESVKRAQRYKEPEVCRIYSRKQKVRIYLPILEWSDKDVSDFVNERNIKCHPLYYTEGGGQFDVAKRLGCICCPLQSRNNRIKDFKRNPQMLRLWIKNGNVCYTKEKKNKFYKDGFEAMGSHLYCNNLADFNEKTHSLFGEFNWKEFFEDEYNIDLNGI
ncbi:MAG: phosphoadenosine phosphosulfate reductase family protein [Phocaeicola sp.]